MKVFDDQGPLTVEIAPTRRWEAVSRDCYMLILWLLMAIGLTQIAPPSTLRDQFLISIVERAALLLLCLIGLCRLTWQLRGREEVILRRQSLTVIWRLGMVGWQRTYPTAELRDLHVGGIGLPKFWRVIGGTLEFTFKGRARRFADRLSREEATKLLNHFRDRLPQSNWTPVLGI